MHTVDHFENEGWFNCDQEIIWMCFVCLVAKQHTMLKWKDAVSVFAFLQASAEPLDRWCRKTNHRLISYFLSNTSAKNYRNRITYDNIITSQTWDVFWDIECTYEIQTVHTYMHHFLCTRCPSCHQCQALKETQSTNLNQLPFFVHHWTPDEGCIAPFMPAFNTNQSTTCQRNENEEKWQYNPTENIYRRDYLYYQAMLLVLRFCPEQTECFQAAEY